MSKTRKSIILKHLASQPEEEEKKHDICQGKYFDCFSDNYLIYSLNEKSFMTQYFVDTEMSYVDMSISPLTEQERNQYIKEKEALSFIKRSRTTSESELISTNEIDLVQEDELQSFYVDESATLDKAELKQNRLFGSYVTYTIINSQGEKIERKYNDFLLLRKLLVNNFPGCYIPKIPDKRISIEDSSEDKSECIQQRKMQIDDFIAKLSSVTHLVSSDIYKAFTRSKSNVNVVMKKYLNPSNTNILNRYKEVFLDLSCKEINFEIMNKIRRFEASLKDRLPVLKQFKAVIRQNIDSFEQKKSKMGNLMSTLGKFEDIFLNYTKDIVCK